MTKRKQAEPDREAYVKAFGEDIVTENEYVFKMLDTVFGTGYYTDGLMLSLAKETR